MRRSTEPRLVRRRRAAKYLYAQLLYLLGNRCAVCGETKGLTVDHVDGITWNRYRVNHLTRVRRYRDELFAGVRLRCLCNLCNAFHQPGREEREIEEGEPLPPQAVADVPF